MVPVVDIARVLVGRLDIKHVVDTRSCRPARVDGRTPLPLYGYAGYRGAEYTAPDRRNTAARQSRRHWESQTGKEDFITTGYRNGRRPGIIAERRGGASGVRAEDNYPVRNGCRERAGRYGRTTEADRRARGRYPARLDMGIKPDGIACRNRCAVKVRLN